MLNLRRQVLAAFLGCGACVPKVEDDLSTITEPRLLAVKSTPAEAAPDDSVELQSLVATPDAEQVSSIHWAWCIERKPLTELGPVSPACLDSSDPRATQAIGDGLSVEGQLARDACQLFGPTLPPPTHGQPSGRPVDPDLTGGFYQPFIASRDHGDHALGNVRLLCGPAAGTPREQLIEYNEKYQPNQNPAIESLSVTLGNTVTELHPDATALPNAEAVANQPLRFQVSWRRCPRTPNCGDGICSAGETQQACADDCAIPSGCAGAESYVVLSDTRQVVSRREALFVSWYATAGKFDNRRTGVSESDPDEPGTTNRWVAPQASGEVRFWIVIRDDRGGVGWQSYRIHVVQQ